MKSQAWIRASRKGISLVVFLVALLVCFSSFAEHDSFSGGDEKYQLGKKVFSDYCTRCHGEHADGRGKITPFYVKMKVARPSNFQLKFFSTRPKQYLSSIIRDGGKKHALSQYMPPFGDELTSRQIGDVVYFIQKVSVYSSDQNSSSLAPTSKK